MTLRIGSRGSKLAVAQAEWVGAELKKKNPQLDISYQRIKTTGDKNMVDPLNQLGGKGIFVKEIEEALLKNEIDVAVHSLKDVPGTLPSGLELGPVPQREDNRDAYLSRFGELLHELPRGSTVGTGSPRRQAQIQFRHKNRYRLQSLRGNVETRIEKLQQGEVDAIILALAGLKRLGLASEVTDILDPQKMLPAPGQGCLGLEIRSNDPEVRGVLESIGDDTSDRTARAERALLQGLGGSCLLPLAGQATIRGPEMWIKAKVWDWPATKEVAVELRGSPEEPELLGGQVAEQLLYNGASDILLTMPDSSSHAH